MVFVGVIQCSSMPDIFGEIIKDATEGLAANHVIERDDGYINETDGKQYVARFEDWLEIEQHAMKYVRGRVLDIGCGAGRVCLYLQEHGFEVTGIDISPTAIETCRRSGVSDVRLMSADAINFPKASFQTVILFGNNFGILGHPDHVVKMLQRLYEVTTSDAVILAETRNPLQTDEKAHLDYHQMNRDRGLPPGLVKIRLRYHDMVGDWFELLMSTPEEMREIAERADWKLIEVIKNDSIFIGVLRKR